MFLACMVLAAQAFLFTFLQGTIFILWSGDIDWEISSLLYLYKYLTPILSAGLCLLQTTLTHSLSPASNLEAVKCLKFHLVPF